MVRRVLIMILLLGLLMGALTFPALGQEAVEVPQEVINLPDPGPVIDDLTQGLEAFYQSAAVLMGFVVYLVTQAVKFVTKKEDVSTETIYGVVVVIFTAGYMIAQIAGEGILLGRVIDIGTLVGNTILAVLGMIFVPSLTFNAAQKVGNPVFGGKQGHERFHLEPPAPPTPVIPSRHDPLSSKYQWLEEGG